MALLKTKNHVIFICVWQLWGDGLPMRDRQRDRDRERSEEEMLGPNLPDHF